MEETKLKDLQIQLTGVSQKVDSIDLNFTIHTKTESFDYMMSIIHIDNKWHPCFLLHRSKECYYCQSNTKSKQCHRFRIFDEVYEILINDPKLRLRYLFLKHDQMELNSFLRSDHRGKNRFGSSTI